jgi:hypothetical protein
MTPERIVIENLLCIVNKDSVDVDFKLNSAQVLLDNNLTGRDLVPKARREGVSSYFLARNTVRCLSQHNTTAVVISHESDATQRMLDKVRYYLDTIKAPKAVIKNNSKNEISFPKTNSVFYIGTAGSKNFGRGDTITDLHCSELAYWADQRRMATGLFQAAANGRISIESTGNGPGDYYHSMCVRSAKGQSRFKLHFLPWHTFPEYTHELSQEQTSNILSNLDDSLEEPDLVSQFHLTAGQLSWRREKLDELDYNLHGFKREYPMTLDECFAATGSGIFTRVRYEDTARWKKTSQFLWQLEGHPSPDKHYVVGCDVAAGVGKDSSVMEIFCIETEEQVAEWISNRTEPDVFATHIAHLAAAYGNAYTAVEANNHGILTLGELKKFYPSFLIHRTLQPRRNPDIVTRLAEYGVRTTARNKPYIIGVLRKSLAQTGLIHSQILKDECNTFVEHEDGSMGAVEGQHDDTVIAAALALYVLPRASLIIPQMKTVNPSSLAPDIFSLDYIIKEMHGRNNVYPIRPQVSLEYEQ